MTGLLGGVRKAFKTKGDDPTLTRFVKLTKDEKKQRGKSRQYRIADVPTVKMAAVFAEGRSVFYRRGVKAVAALKNVLVSGHNNVKIGRDVRKGRLFRGYWIYTLSLEERATCPRSCQHWQTCYGNNMPFATRVEHGRDLMVALDRDVTKMLAVRGRAGLLVRLHALGDFYSVEYVRFWSWMLDRHPRLAVYGYTARPRDSAIGAAIAIAKARFGSRFAVRWSDGGLETDCTVSIRSKDQLPKGAFICPEQTGATAACATCGLCWNIDRNVAFLEH